MLTLLFACSVSAGDKDPAPIPPVGPGQAEAVFAGGCFWCMEADFDKLPGVVHTTSGFAGGRTQDPSYEQVGAHGTGHAEVVRVVYDTSLLTYETVLDYFWHHVDPTDAGGQFCDRGESYRPAIFPLDATQRQAAEASSRTIAATGMKVAVTIEEGRFWPAEVYHQDYHHTNPARYNSYRMGCGRDARVQKVWGSS